MRILFLGLPLAACLLARDGHEIVLAGLSRGDTPGRRRLRAVLGDDLVVTRPTLDDAFVARARSLAPDLLVSWFWTKKIPMTLVEVAPLGGIGVHPSLLPRHRGPDPTTWAILTGDAVTGVTCHRIEAEYDTGAVLLQEELAIDPRWNAWDLARALDRPSLRVLRDACRRYAEGVPPAPRAQDAAAATSAPFLEEGEQEIAWDAPTARVLALVRALAPSPAAFTRVGDATVAVLAASAAAAPAVLERPGEAAVVGGAPVVRTGDGAVRLDRVERGGVALSARELHDLFSVTRT